MTGRVDGLFAGLFDGLFDDASLYPPSSAELPVALPRHAVHTLAWYGDTVGPFVCNVERLAAVAAQVRALRLGPLDIALVVPAGLDRLSVALATLKQYPELRLRTVETPLDPGRREDVLRFLRPVTTRAAVFLEIPVLSLTERHVHDLKAEGLGVKLRIGGTRTDSFRTEKELGRAILLCAAERLPFTCAAGLQHAVRQRDARTLFEQHGFLNIALAARVAAATASLDATATTLAQRDAAGLAYRVGDLSEADVVAVRALFASFAATSIGDSVTDLIRLGLAVAP